MISEESLFAIGRVGKTQVAGVWEGNRLVRVDERGKVICKRDERTKYSALTECHQVSSNDDFSLGSKNAFSLDGESAKMYFIFDRLSNGVLVIGR